MNDAAISKAEKHYKRLSKAERQSPPLRRILKDLGKAYGEFDGPLYHAFVADVAELVRTFPYRHRPQPFTDERFNKVRGDLDRAAGAYVPVILKVYWQRYGHEPDNQLTADFPHDFPVRGSPVSADATPSAPTAPPSGLPGADSGQAEVSEPPPTEARAREPVVEIAPPEPAPLAAQPRPSSGKRRLPWAVAIGVVVVVGSVAGWTILGLNKEPEGRPPASESRDAPAVVGPKSQAASAPPPADKVAAPAPGEAKPGPVPPPPSPKLKIADPPVEKADAGAPGVTPVDVTGADLLGALRADQGRRLGTTKDGLYPIYLVTMRLDLTPAQKASIQWVSYEFHHEHWKPPVKRGGAASKGYPVSWDGYGCNIDVTVTAKLRTGSLVSEQFNLCTVWKMA